MMAVLVLICAAGMARVDCQAWNAVDFIRPPAAANAVMCGLHGQAFAAELAGVKELLAAEPGRYVKITCTQTTIGRSVG